MYYSIRHVTTFRYSAPISESVMELRMQPRSEERQRCHSFDLRVEPRARLRSYRDFLGNHVHHFDIPRAHSQLRIAAEALVEIAPAPELPAALDPGAWDALERLVAAGDYWDWLMPSRFAQPTPLLHDLARELGLAVNAPRAADPLTVLRGITSAIYDTFSYVPQSTAVDSPIDDALRARAGVCQDYAHVMIALVRELGIPCRYVSGYLFHRTDIADRSAQDATHAWVEALLPELGWIGFDPTNNLVVEDRHVRTAVGRDYADVPPTRGVFKGVAESELEVAVQVTPAAAPPIDAPVLTAPAWSALEPVAQVQQQQQ